MTEADVCANEAPSRHSTSIATCSGYSWTWPFKPTTAEEFAEEFQKDASYLLKDADGSSSWDPQAHKGWPEGSPGNVLEVLGHLGHRDDLLRWAKSGVPAPLTIPLTQLDENHFSRWFPNTGF
jgi:hypothetical protein